MSIFNKIKDSVVSHYTPRLGYTHIFIEDESRHSMLHIQNPFSFFWPEGSPVAEAQISINNSEGKLIGSATRKIQPFAMLALSVHDLMQELGEDISLGTITVDLVPPRAYCEYLKSINGSDGRISSPFWMRFYDDSGSQAYVHAIEADRTRVHGVPRFISYLITRRDTSSAWASDRTIRLEEGETAVAYIVNHGRRTNYCNASWVSPENGKLYSAELKIESKGVVEFPVSLVGDVYLSVSQISTSNAKPYVMLISAKNQFALTHG
jgi:hypothetical protein